MPQKPEPFLVLLDTNGIYIPQMWCNDVTEEQASQINIDWTDVQTCQAGPDHELYWDSWTAILDNAEMKDSDGVLWTLHQDGDLWQVPSTFVFPES